MRALTEAEARVIGTLLAARPDRERDRLRNSGIARSTYYAVRRRAYLEGWLHDRYVPDPSRLGYEYASFVVARPFLDRYSEFVAQPVGPAICQSVLWTSPQIALLVWFHRLPNAGADELRRWESAHLLASSDRYTVSLLDPSVPVYFDYEGLWAHLIGQEGTSGYPHGLGGRSVDEKAGPVSPPSPRTTWAFRELVHRSVKAEERGEDGHLPGLFGLPYSQRRLLVQGWITHRVFLEPARLPSYDGRTADHIYFISGTPRAGARPELLFETLTRDCLVFPFLYVVSPERWLIGALGGALPGAGPAQVPGRARRSVVESLRAALEGIETVHDAAASFSMVVNHRYDSLVPGR